MLDRAEVVDENFKTRVKNNHLPIPQGGFSSLPVNKKTLIDWFDSQIKSRQLDIVARKLKEKGQSFYTIGSSGHEGNAVLGHVFPYTDPALLHYRSGAFFIQRAKQLKELDGVQDVLLSLVASSEDKISRGRHKVFGSVPLNIPPQTSTIASHLPKALGLALSIQRASDLNIEAQYGANSVVLVSFGDASCNHASSQTTFNACGWIRQSSVPLPLIFICEDNGLGISVPSPRNWVKHNFEDRLGMTYLDADGLDVIDMYNTTMQAQTIAREKKEPVFLHVKCKRLLGHAGSDIESQYLTQEQIDFNESQDPLLYTASILLHHGLMSQKDILSMYQDIRADIDAMALTVIDKPKLSSTKEVMASIVPRSEKQVAYLLPSEKARRSVFATDFDKLQAKVNLKQSINYALTDLMLQYPQLVIFGEDVGRKGGVYQVTRGLYRQFGGRRVFDTLLDETTILGTAIGLAQNGFIPMPEIQFLAYFHNAEDQLRGEAATLSFFSDGQYRNPMVVRIASLAYQKGFGGHFHNDNSIAVLRDIPGIIIACPSNSEDAPKLLRQCVKLAYEQGRVVVFLEPIALYMTKDLHEPRDNAWLSVYPSPEKSLDLDEVGVDGEGDFVIVTYGNGYYLSRKAQKILKDKYQTNIKVVDLRWLKPLPIKALINQVKKAKHVLIVDECRKTGSLSEALVTALVEHLSPLPNIKRLTGEDCFIPLGKAWEHVLPLDNDIVATVVEMLNNKENAGGRFSIT